MLSINEQTELEVLQSIEEPNDSQKERIEYLLSKKVSEMQMKSFEPVDIDSMECKCLNCFLRTLPEHSEQKLLILEINRFFEYKSKNPKYSNFSKPEIAAMREAVLKECKITQVYDSNVKSNTDLVTIDTVIHKYLEEKLSNKEIEKLLEDPEFIRNIYEACLFIIQIQIESAEKYKLKSLIAIQSYYMTVDLMFSVLDKLDYEPSWDLVNIIHGNMARELKVLSKLSDLVPNELLHSNCYPSEEDVINILKGIFNAN